MLVDKALLTSGNTAAASSANTVVISPTANRLIFVVVASKINGTPPNAPTITGASMTWDQIASLAYNPSQNIRLTVFRALSSSPGSGALALNFAAQVQDRINWSIIELRNVYTIGSNGNNAIVQSGTTTQNLSSAGITLNLSTFGSPNNAVIAALYALEVVTINPGTGFTELSNNSDGECVLEVEFKGSNDTSVDWTWASRTFPVEAIAVEIKVKPGGGGFII